jgi:hypothetical protein
MMSAGETIVAIYDGFENANAVLQALLDEGFLQSDVGLVVSNRNGAYDNLGLRLKQFEIIDDEENGFGALLASVGGALFAPQSIEIPGLGTMIAAGPLVDLLGGETGMVMGGVTASLVHLGVPYHEAGYYAEAVGRGYALITVHIRTEKAMEIALDTLRRHHPLTLKSRTNQWMGFDSQIEPATYDEFGEQRNTYSATQEAIGRFPYVRMSPS